MATVHANGRAIAHKGDGQTNTAAPPDACKTPTPGGPVPIPYVNVAMSSDLANGTTSVKIEGHSVAKADSNLSTSSGDEPGTAGGGLMSSKTKGKLTWGSHSSDVLFEGKGVVRFMDVAQHNGNSFNTAFIDDGHTGLAYGDDFEGKCPACEKNPEEHPRVKEEKSLAEIAVKILKALRDKPHSQSCMVAVGRCKCGQTIAAASGTNKLNAFKSTVEAAGCGATIVLGTAAGGAASIEALTKSLSSSVIGQRAQKELTSRWDRLKAVTAEKPPPGHTRPGQCAAQKVFASGHAIVAMSEMYYQPPASVPKSFTYKLRATFDGKTAPMPYDSVKEKAQAEENQSIGVASCKTCQALLPFLLCEDSSC